MKQRVLCSAILIVSLAVLPASAVAATYSDVRDFTSENDGKGHLAQGRLAHGTGTGFSWSFWHPESYPAEKIDWRGLTSARITISVLDAMDPLRLPFEIVLAAVPGDVGTSFLRRLESRSFGLDVDIASILETGGLEVTVLALLGDFYIQRSVLELIYDGDVAPVPEPATFLLLGSGLVGMAMAIRRRSAARKS